MRVMNFSIVLLSAVCLYCCQANDDFIEPNPTEEDSCVYERTQIGDYCNTLISGLDSTNCPPNYLGTYYTSDALKNLACELENQDQLFVSAENDTMHLNYGDVKFYLRTKFNPSYSANYICDEDSTKYELWCYEYEGYSLVATSDYDSLKIQFDLRNQPIFIEQLEGKSYGEFIIAVELEDGRISIVKHLIDPGDTGFDLSDNFINSDG